MAEQQKRFEPWTLFTEACWKLRGEPNPADLGYKGTSKDPRRIRALLSDTGVEISYSQRRSEYTIAIQCDPQPPTKDAATGDVVSLLTLAVNPSLSGKPYIRLLAKRPLTRPYDLASIMDAQGAELQPFFSTPRDDIEVRSSGYVIPAGASEWYGGSGLTLLAVSARGRITCDVATCQEVDGKYYLRLHKLCDVTVALLGGKLASPKGRSEIFSLMGDAGVCVDKVQELWDLVNTDYGLAQAGETESKYLLRLRRERIEDRKQERPVAQQFAPEETEQPEVPEDLGAEAKEQGKAEAEPKPDEVKKGGSKKRAAKAKGNGKAVASEPAPAPDAGSLPAPTRDAARKKGYKLGKLKGAKDTNPAGE